MKLAAFFLAILLCSAGTAKAQGSHVADCDSALSQAVLVYDSSDTYDWRLATLVTEGQWNTQKSSAGGSSAIYGVPMGGTFSEYKKNIQQFYAQHNETISATQSRAIAWRGLQGTNVTAYTACLNALKRSKPGLYIFVDKLTDQSATLSLYYNAGGSDPNRIVISIVDQAGNAPARAPRSLVKATTVQFTVVRPATGETTYTVNSANGAINADSIVIPGLPRKVPPVWTVTMNGVDDEMSCQLNGTAIGSVSIGTAVTGKDVTFAVIPRGNTLSCRPQDVYKAYGRYPCWAYNVELRRDGYLKYASNMRQCHEGAPAQPEPVSYTFDDALPPDLQTMKASLGLVTR